MLAQTMNRNKYRTAKKQPSHDIGKAPFYLALLFIVVVGYAVWATQYILLNREAALIGHSVSCNDRPSFDYFAFCTPLRDGAACTYESQSRMMRFYEPIDYACAQLEPSRVFRFPVEKEPETLEVAEVTG
jgi:hypothetical protein